jgi:hypothetical protein
MPRYFILSTITFRSLLLPDECQLTLFAIYTYFRHFKLTDSDGSLFVNIRQKPLTHINLFQIYTYYSFVKKLQNLFRHNCDSFSYILGFG